MKYEKNLKKKIIIIVLLLIFISFVVLGYKFYCFINYFDRNTEPTTQYIEKAQKNIKEKGYTIETKLELAGGYFAAKHYHTAINLFDEVAQNDPRGYWGMALAFDRLENYEEVIKNIDLFLLNSYKLSKEIYNNDSYKSLYILKAQAHFKLHQYRRCLRSYLQANRLGAAQRI